MKLRKKMIQENVDDDLFTSSTQTSYRPPKPIHNINEKIKEAKKNFLKTLENREKDKTWLYNELKSAMQLESNYANASMPERSTQACQSTAIYDQNIPQEDNRAKTKNTALLRIHCSFCDVNCTREYFYNQHILKFPHSCLTILETQYSPEIISSLYLVKNETEIVCNICQVTMKCFNDVKSHVNGIGHVKTFKCSFPEVVFKRLEKLEDPSNIADDGQSITRGSVATKPSTCNPVAKTTNSASLKIYCSDCDFNYTRDSFYDHESKFPHSSINLLKTKYSSETVNSLYTIRNGTEILCNLCNAIMKCSNDVKSHTNGIKHIKNLKRKFPRPVCKPEEKELQQEGLPLAKPYCAPKAKRQAFKANKQSAGVDYHLSTPQGSFPPIIHPAKQIPYIINCPDCNCLCTRKYFYDCHIATFPHFSMSLLKVHYSPEIVNSLFVVKEARHIICNLCKVTMKCSNDVKAHVNGIKHCKRFESILFLNYF